MVSIAASPPRSTGKKRKSPIPDEVVENGVETAPIVPTKRKRGRPPSRKRLLMEAKHAASGLANGDVGKTNNARHGVNSKKRKRENGKQTTVKGSSKFKRAKNGTHRDLSVHTGEDEDEIDPLLSVIENGRSKSAKRTREAYKKDAGVRKRRRPNGKTGVQVNGKHVTKRRTKKKEEPESGEEEENASSSKSKDKEKAKKEKKEREKKQKEKESVPVKRGRGRPGRPKKKDKVGEKKKKAQVKSRARKKVEVQEIVSNNKEENGVSREQQTRRARKPSQRIQKSKEKAERLKKWKAMTKGREQRHTNRRKRRQSA